MEIQLFTDRSLWTMVHGIALTGAAMMALSAVLFSLLTLHAGNIDEQAASIQSRYVAWLSVFVSVMLWSTVLVGTYVIFPSYRAVPPEGVADLGMFPKALIQANPATAWLHSFGMETKEHVPWITAMLATAVTFVSIRYRAQLLRDATLNKAAAWLIGICLVLVSYVALLGVFVNKVAPLE
ncbi:MAG: hypothetical protein WD423_12520 [Rhodothermales bacterium]